MTQSIEKLQKRLDKDPNSLIFVQLAEEYRKEGSLEDALRILKGGLLRHPNYWSARVTLGRIYHYMGNDAMAREELERVISAVPDHLLANRLLGDIYTAMQLPQEALQRYRIVEMIAPADEVLKEQISRLESQVAELQPQRVQLEENQPVLLEMQDEAQPLPESERGTETPQPTIVESEGEPKQEVYAPTIQIQVPDFLEKTEVPVSDGEPQIGEWIAEEELQEDAVEKQEQAAIATEQQRSDNGPSVEELADSAIDEIAKEASHLPDTLILEPKLEEIFRAVEEPQPIEDLQEEKELEQIHDSEELSSLANLLLSTEEDIITGPQHFQELEAGFVREPEAEIGDLVRGKHQDRTQPLDEDEEEPEDADELTTETLAELYLNQGLTEKAIKVYQRLLLNDPGNPQILRRLEELSFHPNVPEPEQVREEAVLVENHEQIEKLEEAGANNLFQEDPVGRRAEERQRKINTLENWLSMMRRERD